MKFEDLEKAVDDHGVYAVVMALAEICDFKGQHIVENWQDAPLARHWQKAAHALEQTCERFKAHSPGVLAGHMGHEVPGIRT